MRGGYPVRVVQKSHKQFKSLKEAIANIDVAADWYWCVSAGMIGYCGHKHRKQEAAEKCLEPMTLAYREKRWPGSTKKGKA